MLTNIYIPDKCKSHNPSTQHPECPARINAISQILDAEPIGQTAIVKHEHRMDIEKTHLTHDARYIDHLQSSAPTTGVFALDGDTLMDRHSIDAALLAAGTVDRALQSVCNGFADNAFCVVRPPGHHAEFHSGMGFCFFNSIALAAMSAIKNFGLERIAILDFDVHHGNGTEDIFKDEERVLLCSSYQYPLYPFRNNPSLENRLVNVPLEAGTGSALFREAITTTWWPALKTFRPQLILVSAGFDAHRLDPLAGLALETADYDWLGQQITEQASLHCNDRLVATLEGGYHLEALAASTHAFINRMAGH